MARGRQGQISVSKRFEGGGVVCQKMVGSTWWCGAAALWREKIRLDQRQKD